MSLAPARPRSDALPEGNDYPDIGCDLQPSCLRCTLATCRHDLPLGLATVHHGRRRAAVATLHSQGATVHQIAAHLRISWRTVFRHLKAIREGRVKVA
jgi:DNA-binding transcriptional ArsR family regulator